MHFHDFCNIILLINYLILLILKQGIFAFLLSRYVGTYLSEKGPSQPFMSQTTSIFNRSWIPFRTLKRSNLKQIITIGFFKAKDIEFRRVIHSGFFSNSGSKMKEKKSTLILRVVETQIFYNMRTKNYSNFRFRYTWVQNQVITTNYLILKAQGVLSLKVQVENISQHPLYQVRSCDSFFTEKFQWK